MNTEKIWRKMKKMDGNNNPYSNVNLKLPIAKRFRKFSKKIAKTHSETLRIIMDFFEWHGFMPSDRFGKSLLQEIIKNRKRTDASIAIIKNIEKDQTKPTNAMLLSLFEENALQDETEGPELVEKKFAEKKPEELIAVETTVPKIRFDRLHEKMNLVKQDFNYVLDKVKVVKSSFGKDYLKLELTEEELIKIKRTLKNS